MTELDGIWDISIALDAGRDVIEANAYLRIQGDRFERVTEKHVFIRTLHICDDRSPKTIDLFITNEPNKGETFLGIYKIEGDMLFIAHAKPKKERPTVFESTRENGFILSVSKRRI